MNPVDRWGSTPMNDARNERIIELLTLNGGKKNDVDLSFNLLHYYTY